MDEKPKSEDHFYHCDNELYRQGLLESLKAVDSLLTDKEKKKLINEKLQFDMASFNVDQYVQSACELSVLARMYVDFPKGFQYEPKKNTEEKHINKDVDFSFCYGLGDFGFDLDVNVEVKCFKVEPSVRGRFLSIKDFFVSSNDKFGKQDLCSFNVLYICCYDLVDYIDVCVSLGGNSGLCFRKNASTATVIDVDDFPKIDCVVVSNLGFLHHDFNRDNDGDFLNPWDSKNSFHMGFMVHRGVERFFYNDLGQLVKVGFNLQNDSYISFCEKQSISKEDFSTSLKAYVNFLNDECDCYYFVGDK